MTPWHLANIAAHVSAGVIGLAIGLLPLLSVKGGARHRRWGRIFVALASMVIGAAILSDIFANPPMPLVVVTLSAAYQFVGSLRALALKDHGPNGWDALLSLAAIATAVAIALFMGPGTASFTPAIGYSTLGYVVALASYDLSRHFWAALWSDLVRPLDHGLKMVGVYFAMASAGAGNFLRAFQPWSQLLPNLLGVMVMIGFAYAYFRRGRREGLLAKV